MVHFICSFDRSRPALSSVEGWSPFSFALSSAFGRYANSEWSGLGYLFSVKTETGGCKSSLINLEKKRVLHCRDYIYSDAKCPREATQLGDETSRGE